MKQSEQATRREAIAEDVADGMTEPEAAVKYRVGTSTVRRACIEHGLFLIRGWKRPIRRPGSLADAKALKSLAKSSAATARKVAKIARKST